MNLTDRQNDLLQLLASKYQSNGGLTFIFVRSHSGSAVVYPGDSIPVENDDLDFYQLRHDGLITLVSSSRNQWRGKLTERGIMAARTMSRPTRLMQVYEDRCPLLVGPAVRERLNQLGAERARKLNGWIETSSNRLRKLEEAERERLGQISEMPLRRVAETMALRQEGLGIAADAGAEAVQAFANALQLSQGRLVVHKNLLREYAARLIGQIRERLSTSEVFPGLLQSSWESDPVAQTAIDKCEAIIKDAKKRERLGQSDNRAEDQSDVGPNKWSPIVLEWEATKSTGELVIAERERIPEVDLRRIIANESGSKPEEVTDADIENAALELCHHYDSFEIVPPALAAPLPGVDGSQYQSAIPDPVFWKEREDEFRKHDTGQNARLGAMWESYGNSWSFHVGADVTSPSADLLSLFKSLAREAAKGLGSKRGRESWIDWLDLLRCARDEDTGELLCANMMEGSSQLSEREFNDMIFAGHPPPEGSRIVFAQTGNGALARFRCWDTHGATIDSLFRYSASLCLRLRSLAPHSRSENAAGLHGGLEAHVPAAKHVGAEQPINNPESEQAQLNPNLTAAAVATEHASKVADVEGALNRGERKRAVELRCSLDSCNITKLWKDAFKSRGGKPATKRTAFNRWQASRPDTPSWADELMRARLVK